VFESGAILQYLGNKTGKFYPQRPRERVKVEEWLFWQVGNLGPMAGQAHHFRNYAREDMPYAITRYTREVTRCYRVMDRRLAGREFLGGDYSIADMACYGWVVPHKRQGQNLDDVPNLKRWFENRRAPRGRARHGGGRGQRKRPRLQGPTIKAYELLFGDGQLR
jgi:GSH-dependent disulfide-bond oxidoreductase